SSSRQNYLSGWRIRILKCGTTFSLRSNAKDSRGRSRQSAPTELLSSRIHRACVNALRALLPSLIGRSIDLTARFLSAMLKSFHNHNSHRDALQVHLSTPAIHLPDWLHGLRQVDGRGLAGGKAGMGF